MSAAEVATERERIQERYRVLEDDAYDVIVVGAGFGGLVTAALLARAGRKVLVFDQHSVAGGNATIFKRRGYEFDVGVHYLGGCDPCGLIPRILRACGVDDVEFQELDPDGFDTIVLPERRFKIPRGIDAFRDRLVEAFPSERKGIERYAKLLHQLETLQGAAASPLWVLCAVPRVFFLLRWANSSFGAFLDSCTPNPELRTIIVSQNLTYGLPPERASLVQGAGVAHHYLQGSYYPKGGGQILSDRLVEAIERQGGKVLLLARGERILVEDGRVTGVELLSKHLGRRRISAPVVVSNADLKATLLDLVDSEHLRGKTRARVDGYEMAPGLGVVYLGLKRDLVAEGHRITNYYVFQQVDTALTYAAVARGELPPRPFVYVTSSSLKDPTHPSMAPDGITNMQVMSIAPSNPEAWGVTPEQVADRSYRKSAAYKAKKAEYVDLLLTTAERAFPGIKNQIAYSEVATPLTHTRYTGATGGTSFGIAATPEQFLVGRPGPSTEVRGLYLCGASCRTGTGIVGVALSGVHAAGGILGQNLHKAIVTA